MLKKWLYVKQTRASSDAWNIWAIIRLWKRNKSQCNGFKQIYTCTNHFDSPGFLIFIYFILRQLTNANVRNHIHIKYIVLYHTHYCLYAHMAILKYTSEHRVDLWLLSNEHSQNLKRQSLLFLQKCKKVPKNITVYLREKVVLSYSNVLNLFIRQKHLPYYHLIECF